MSGTLPVPPQPVPLQRPVPPNIIHINPIPPTNFSNFVLDALKTARQSDGREPTVSASTSSDTPAPTNQAVIRRCFELTSSFLITDITGKQSLPPLKANEGMVGWINGLHFLVDLVVALHSRGELEVATLSAANRACSESWTAAGQWKNMEACRDFIRENGRKLKTLMDENGRTYQGQSVYAP